VDINNEIEIMNDSNTDVKYTYIEINCKDTYDGKDLFIIKNIL
jgi:hypothetical protein